MHKSKKGGEWGGAMDFWKPNPIVWPPSSPIWRDESICPEGDPTPDVRRWGSKLQGALSNVPVPPFQPALA